MDIFYKGRKNRTKANGTYDANTGVTIVKKGSIVSENVAEFKNKENILRLREKYVNDNGVVNEDIQFASASSAASFVAGYSVNGLIAWHVDKHVTLREELKDR